MACACGAAEACEACWQAWPSGTEVGEAAILRACRDRRQSGSIERLLQGSAPGGAARAVLSHAPALCSDVFGSHVVQCALAAVGRGLAAASAPPQHLLRAVAATAESLLSGAAFTATAADACGTHVARALLLLLAGSCPARRTKKAGAAARREESWPATAAFAAPPELSACLRRVAEAAAAALRARGTRLSCDTHAAPVLATLLRACAAASLEAQLLELLAALALPDTASACRLLAVSPGGSRVLEAALATAPPAALDAWLIRGVLANAAAWLGPGTTLAASAPAAAAPSISFILAADGSARAFKPGHDESQWWCRRDAHARIAAAALWCAGAASCSLLYADASVMTMEPDVTQRCVVPTEAALVALWRDAAAGKRVPGVRAWRPATAASEFEALESAFANLLAPLQAQHSRVCVCLLHEDYAAELPVWGRLPPSGESGGPTHVVFIGGAVRDLTTSEAEAAEAASHAHGFAFVGANLGRVPEFSSKVVATLGVHHANGRALPAVAALARKACAAASGGDAMAMLPPAAMRRVRAPVALRFVLRAPFAAAALNTAPEGREALQPTLRAVVAALWRSRLADEEARRGEQTAAAALASCHVLLCFDGDGAALSLGPDFVARLAAAHAAAPSEHQVLAALEAEVAATPLPRADAALRAAVTAPGLAAVLELHLSPSTGPPYCADLAAAAYADRCACSGAVAAPLAGDVLAFLDCRAPDGCSALRARLTPPAAAATPAAAACFLQQLQYHGRLAPALALAQAAGPAVPAAPTAPIVYTARGGSASTATARFVFAAALDAARTEAQLQPLVAAVASAALQSRDAAAAAVLAATARAARRIGACHDAAAAAAYAGRDASGLWRALLCGGGGGGGATATSYESYAEPCDAGAALLSELLLLPPAGCTAPLRAGFRALLRPPGAPALRAWAQSAAGSRALEAALGPSCAALPLRLRRRAAHALLLPGDALQLLCLHPKASWVVAALWDAMQGGRQRGRRAALRAAFQAQLAAVPQLQATNPRLWTRCGMDHKQAA